MKRALLALVLVGGCGADSEVTIISGFEMEDRARSEQSTLVRGPSAIGESCTANTDCFALSCVDGVCAHPCIAAGCPDAAACYARVLETPCESHTDCDREAACGNRGCACVEVPGLSGRCTVTPYCYAYCDVENRCPSGSRCDVARLGVQLPLCYPDAWVAD